MIEGLEPDSRDDVYAIACVAYELLTGKHPFNRISAVEARDKKMVAEAAAWPEAPAVAARSSTACSSTARTARPRRSSSSTS